MLDAIVRGWLLDAILVLVALEAVALYLWKGRGGGQWSLAAIVANLGSGAALMLAVRAALHRSSAEIILMFLALAFAAHLTDLWLRLRR